MQRDQSGIGVTAMKAIKIILLTILGMFVGVVLVMFNMLPDNDKYRNSRAETICKTNWTKCTDNADLVNNWHDYYKIRAACKLAADDTAKYGDPEWPSPYFLKFYGGDEYIRTGFAFAVEDNVRFINGFNAKPRVELVCAYNLKTGKVVKIYLDGKTVLNRAGDTLTQRPG